MYIKPYYIDDFIRKYGERFFEWAYERYLIQQFITIIQGVLKLFQNYRSRAVFQYTDPQTYYRLNCSNTKSNLQLHYAEKKEDKLRVFFIGSENPLDNLFLPNIANNIKQCNRFSHYISSKHDRSSYFEEGFQLEPTSIKTSYFDILQKFTCYLERPHMQYRWGSPLDAELSTYEYATKFGSL